MTDLHRRGLNEGRQPNDPSVTRAFGDPACAPVKVVATPEDLAYLTPTFIVCCGGCCDDHAVTTAEVPPTRCPYCGSTEIHVQAFPS